MEGAFFFLSLQNGFGATTDTVALSTFLLKPGALVFVDVCLDHSRVWLDERERETSSEGLGRGVSDPGGASAASPRPRRR